MKSKINLFRKKDLQKTDPRMLYGAVGIFVVVFVLSLGTLLYYQSLKNNLTSLDAQEVQLRQEINTSYAQKKADMLVLKDRLQNIQRILAGRSDMTTKVTTILRSLPQGLSIDGISSKPNQVTMQFSSDSLFEINSLLEEDILEFPQTQAGGLRKIDLGSFGVDKKTSKYKFSLVFTF